MLRLTKLELFARNVGRPIAVGLLKRGVRPEVWLAGKKGVTAYAVEHFENVGPKRKWIGRVYVEYDRRR